jgi:hypothetical protein
MLFNCASSSAIRAFIASSSFNTSAGTGAADGWVPVVGCAGAVVPPFCAKQALCKSIMEIKPIIIRELKLTRNFVMEVLLFSWIQVQLVASPSWPEASNSFGTEPHNLSARRNFRFQNYALLVAAQLPNITLDGDCHHNRSAHYFHPEAIVPKVRKE